MQALVARLQTDMPRAFETEEYEQARTKIGREFEEARDAEFAKLSELAEGRGLCAGADCRRSAHRAGHQRPAGRAGRHRQAAGQAATADSKPRAVTWKTRWPMCLRVVRERDKEAKAKLLDLDRQVAGFTVGSSAG